MVKAYLKCQGTAWKKVKQLESASPTWYCECCGEYCHIWSILSICQCVQLILHPSVEKGQKQKNKKITN